MIEIPYIFETLLPIQRDINSINIVPPDRNNNIGVIFDNFLRDNTMFNLVESIFRYAPGVKLYVVEQGVFDYATNELYKKLKLVGHEVIILPFDSGISRARNAGIRACKEEYMFIMDCDEVFTKFTDLKALISILEDSTDLGLVGMTEICENKEHIYEYNLEYKEPKHLVYVPLEETEPLSYCDYTHNLFMARRELFDEVMYRDDMKLAEHLDFFMQIKFNTRWKVATTKEYSILNQNTKIKDPLYDMYRHRGSQHFWNLYRKYWKLEKINDWKLPSEDIDNTCHYYLYKEPAPIKPVEQPKPMQVKEVKKEIMVDSAPKIKENVISFFRELFTNNDIWLIENSCLELVKGKLGYSDKVSIAYAQPLIKSEIERLAKKFDIKLIKLSNEFKKPTKIIEYDNIKIQVPYPVVAYLNKFYGKRWDK